MNEWGSSPERNKQAGSTAPTASTRRETRFSRHQEPTTGEEEEGKAKQSQGSKRVRKKKEDAARARKSSRHQTPTTEEEANQSETTHEDSDPESKGNSGSFAKISFDDEEVAKLSQKLADLHELRQTHCALEIRRLLLCKLLAYIRYFAIQLKNRPSGVRQCPL